MSIKMLSFNEQRGEAELLCFTAAHLKHTEPVQHELWWTWRFLFAGAERVLSLALAN